MVVADTFESEIYRAGLRCFPAVTEHSCLWRTAYLQWVELIACLILLCAVAQLSFVQQIHTGKVGTYLVGRYVESCRFSHWML